ncbi:MAG: hypothetical protein ACI95C_001706 [Pseudohongiellaceae bacterium]|jgi:hypothetical protein
MLSKLLVTIIVIALAIFAVKRRQLERNLSSAPSLASLKAKAANAADKAQLNKDLKVGAYLFVAFIAGIGGLMYYFDWQDDHTVLSVNLIRNADTEPVTYLVYKYQLEDKSFVTVDGKTVTVASDERMEIEGLKN